MSFIDEQSEGSPQNASAPSEKHKNTSADIPDSKKSLLPACFRTPPLPLINDELVFKTPELPLRPVNSSQSSTPCPSSRKNKPGGFLDFFKSLTFNPEPSILNLETPNQLKLLSESKDTKIESLASNETFVIESKGNHSPLMVQPPKASSEAIPKFKPTPEAMDGDVFESQDEDKENEPPINTTHNLKTTPIVRKSKISSANSESPIVMIERNEELEKRISSGLQQPDSPTLDQNSSLTKIYSDKSHEFEAKDSVVNDLQIMSSNIRPPTIAHSKNVSSLGLKKNSIPPNLKVNKLILEKQRADYIKQKIEEKEAKSKRVLEEKKAQKQAKLQENKAKFDEVQKKIKMKKFLEEKSTAINPPSVSSSAVSSATNLTTTTDQSSLRTSSAQPQSVGTGLSHKLSAIKKSFRKSLAKPIISSMSIEFMNSDESDNENDNATNPYASWAVSEKMAELREIMRNHQPPKPFDPIVPYDESEVFGKYFYHKKLRTSSIIWND